MSKQQKNKAPSCAKESPAISFQKILNDLPDVCLVMTDCKGVIQYINHETYKLIGFTESDLLNRSFATLLPENESDFQKVFKQLKKNDRVSNLRVQYHHKNGKMLPMRLSASLLRDEVGKPKSILFIANDMSAFEKQILKHKEMIKMLEGKNEKLDRFNALAVDRELEMIRLKHEINQLLQKLGRPIKYQSPEKAETQKMKHKEEESR